MIKRTLAAAAFMLWAVALAGCVKHNAPERRTRVTPSPAPRDEGTDVTAERLKRKTSEAAAAINDYLKANQPKLRDKFQKIGDKFTRDKDVWRQKLMEKKRQLQPQIDLLKQKAGELDPKARHAIDEQTAALERESNAADQKMAELESATADGWKAFKQRLKAEDAGKAGVAEPTATGTPAATP